MKVYHQLKEVEREHAPSAVAIGNFDGVHLGHQTLLKQTIHAAKSQNLVPTVLTFYPHPVEVLNPGKKLERLTTTTEKLQFLEDFGVESVLVAPFDHQVAQIKAIDFFQNYLVDGLKAKFVCVGYNFRFGKGREGDAVLLKNLCARNAMAVSIQEPVCESHEKISSSLIRTLIREGKIEEANKKLGRPFRLSGDVRPGDQRGHQLGFPTANVHCPADKILPKNGVYVTRVKWQRQNFLAVCNIGVRPTFSPDTATKVVEVHILDFSMSIYDEIVTLELLHCLREERRFPDIQALKAQIEADIQNARSYFAQKKSSL